MSDRVTNAEVEDVLSSIRRLVSDDNRAEQGFAATVKATFSEESARQIEQVKSNRVKSDRLVLTPALRVAGDGADPRVADAASVPEAAVQDPPENPADVATSSLGFGGDQESEQKTATGGEAPDFAEDYSTDPYDFDKVETTRPTPFVLDDKKLVVAADNVVAADSAVPTSSAVQAEPVETLTDTPEPDFSVGQQVQVETTKPVSNSVALGAKIAALETAIGEISDIWEPDHAGESDYAGTAAQEMTWDEDAPEAAEEAYRPILPPVVLTPKTDEAPAGDDGDTIVSAPQEPEKATTAAAFTSSRNRAPETSATEQIKPETTAAPASNRFDTSEIASAQAAPSPSPSPSPENDMALPGDDQFIDEEMLRDMVGDIVRAELQGALGERITRNVRKLVRREIHRALAAHELE